MVYSSQTRPVGEAVNLLRRRAESQGFLTSEDIAEVYPGEDRDQLETVMQALRKLGVEILADDLDREADPEFESETDQFAGHRSPLPCPDPAAAEDILSLYFREMSSFPLLSLEEEKSIAQRIERGREAAIHLIQLKRSDSSRRSELERLIQDGRQAREHLIKSNTRLVVSVAKRYVGQGVPFLDLIQEGNLGLMKAVEKFEPQRGFRFSTYATWWIRQAITRAVADHGRTIRIPVHMTDRIRVMYRAANDLEQALGRPPTTGELAEQVGVEQGKVRWMMKISWTPLSLESPVGDDEESELGMFVEDETTPSPAQYVYHEMLQERVSEVLSTLSPREARVLKLRFGLGEDRPYTLEEVGRKFGLTRERIRQIEGKALRRLRHPRRSRRLREYL
ncbi:MAG TPA: sigma-70 family RNA polymerase sigma factor [Anaerolineales bacterium]|jgi:RNA polymerase primary sigma factor|nr:sigma-70 family RNA polymerase sigma factor [Anaerolineales bacterium]